MTRCASDRWRLGCPQLHIPVPRWPATSSGNVAGRCGEQYQRAADNGDDGDDGAAHADRTTATATATARLAGLWLTNNDFACSRRNDRRASYTVTPLINFDEAQPYALSGLLASAKAATAG